MSLRFRYRHVHHSVAVYVETSMRALGWKTVADATAVNFAAAPVVYLEFEPEVNGAAVIPNTVVITLGDEPAAVDEELGDGIRLLQFPVFVDIYAENQAIAQSIASDVKTLFEDTAMLVKDFTAGDPGVATSEYLEFDKDDVDVTRPPASFGAQDFRRVWRVVKATARVHYIEGAPADSFDSYFT